MAGLVAGGAKYAGMKMDEKDKAAQAEREQELMKLQQKVMEANERFKASLKVPQYQTIKDTGPDGQTQERTIRSSYDPEAMGFTETEVGSAILPDKQGRAETDAEFFARDPVAFKEYKSAGRAPRGSSGGSSGEKPPKATSLTEAQIESLFSSTNANGESVRDTDKYRNFVSYQARKAQSDPRFRDANFAHQQWANQVGFDPDETPEGTFTVDELERGNGLVETLSESGSVSPGQGPAAPAKDKSAPGASRDNPAPGKAPYPEGTKMKGPDGKLYIVKNGQPVPYGG